MSGHFESRLIFRSRVKSQSCACGAACVLISVCRSSTGFLMTSGYSDLLWSLWMQMFHWSNPRPVDSLKTVSSAPPPWRLLLRLPADLGRWHGHLHWLRLHAAAHHGHSALLWGDPVTRQPPTPHASLGLSVHPCLPHQPARGPGASDTNSLLVFSKQNLGGQRSPAGGGGGRPDCSSSLLRAHEQEVDFNPSPV